MQRTHGANIQLDWQCDKWDAPCKFSLWYIVWSALIVDSRDHLLFNRYQLLQYEILIICLRRMDIRKRFLWTGGNSYKEIIRYISDNYRSNPSLKNEFHKSMKCMRFSLTIDVDDIANSFHLYLRIVIHSILLWAMILIQIFYSLVKISKFCVLQFYT